MNSKNFIPKTAPALELLAVKNIYSSIQTDTFHKIIYIFRKYTVELNIKSHQEKKGFPHGGRHFQKIYGGF